MASTALLKMLGRMMIRRSTGESFNCTYTRVCNPKPSGLSSGQIGKGFQDSHTATSVAALQYLYQFHYPPNNLIHLGFPTPQYHGYLTTQPRNQKQRNHTALQTFQSLQQPRTTYSKSFLGSGTNSTAHVGMCTSDPPCQLDLTSQPSVFLLHHLWRSRCTRGPWAC